MSDPRRYARHLTVDEDDLVTYRQELNEGLVEVLAGLTITFDPEPPHGDAETILRGLQRIGWLSRTLGLHLDELRASGGGGVDG
jgi:hypothetical protein